MLTQRTLQNPIKAFGVGLHTGNPIILKILPAPTDTGIIFKRVDLDPVVEIKASAENVGDTSLSTCLTSGETRIFGSLIVVKSIFVYLWVMFMFMFSLHLWHRHGRSAATTRASWV